jgi:hypothetical protein
LAADRVDYSEVAAAEKAGTFAAQPLRKCGPGEDQP